jgi:hypothetical protein
MPSDSPHWTQAIHIALLAMVLPACSDLRQTSTASPHPVPDSAPAGTASAGFAGAAPIEPAGALSSSPAGPSSQDAAGSPPPSAREIQGYFTATTTRSSLRLWKGPSDRQGYERLTRFTVEVDGAPEYSRVVSVIRFTGVCRSPGKGLDQLLFSFYPERRGGGAIGVLRYDTTERRFKLGFAPKSSRIACGGGRSLFPEGTPALPCTCPWWDGPDDRPGSAAAPADARDILILPEESGGPAFTHGEAGDLPEVTFEGVDRRK